MVAPDVDELLRYFERGHLNPTPSTPALLGAAEQLFSILTPLSPLKKNEEAKAIWLRIPRGTIEDYATFEEMKEWGEVETYEEYLDRWIEEYPEEYCWYELVAVRTLNRDGALGYYGISLGNKTVISATIDDRGFNDRNGYYAEEAAIKLCALVIPAVEESITLLKEDKYNDLIAASLPYQFRTGVLQRLDMWEAEPEAKEYAYDGLPEETVAKFKELIVSGINDENKIGRIKDFTANDFSVPAKLDIHP